MSVDDSRLHADIAGLRADLQHTNKNMERFARALEKALDDLEVRTRKLEAQNAAAPTRADFQELRDFFMKAMGVVGLVSLLGLPTFVYMLTTMGARA